MDCDTVCLPVPYNNSFNVKLNYFLGDWMKSDADYSILVKCKQHGSFQDLKKLKKNPGQAKLEIFNSPGNNRYTHHRFFPFLVYRHVYYSKCL